MIFAYKNIYSPMAVWLHAMNQCMKDLVDVTERGRRGPQGWWQKRTALQALAETVGAEPRAWE